jgi:hypothetical protein
MTLKFNGSAIFVYGAKVSSLQPRAPSRVLFFQSGC